MHVGRYKRLLSRPKGMEAFPRTCSSFCPRKNDYHFFQSRFSHRRQDCIGTPLSLSLSHRRRAVVSASDSRGSCPGFDTQSGHILSSPSTNSRRAVVSYWRKYVHEGLSLSRKSLVRLSKRPDMTIDVNRERKITTHTNTLFPRGNLLYLSLHSRFPLRGKFFPGTRL